MQAIENALEELGSYWRRGVKQKAVVSSGTLLAFGLLVNAIAWLAGALL